MAPPFPIEFDDLIARLDALEGDVDLEDSDADSSVDDEPHDEDWQDRDAGDIEAAS